MCSIRRPSAETETKGAIVPIFAGPRKLRGGLRAGWWPDSRTEDTGVDVRASGPRECLTQGRRWSGSYGRVNPLTIVFVVVWALSMLLHAYSLVSFGDDEVIQTLAERSAPERYEAIGQGR
jgi:hypothetical protein